VSRGSLRIYLGAAPGVGKTFAMLNEGHRRAARGTDVVVAHVDTHGRPNTEAQLDGLELLPRLPLDHGGTTIGELDLDGVLERAPELVLVDELAHTNAPGARHAKRWQDVETLLESGMDVIATLNIAHLESVKDVVETITGIAQGETVPDWVVRQADQIELVDMSPEALRRRLAHGNVYPPAMVDAAMANFFRVGNLTALRELALLWTADNVDDALQEYRGTHGIDAPWETRERVLVALTGAPSGDHLIRRAARMARRSHAELVGVHVRQGDGLHGPAPGRLDEHRQLLVDLGGTYHEVVGADVADALIGTARSIDATQLVIGSTAQTRLAQLVRGSVINKVIRRSGAIDVHVISTDAARSPGRLPAIGTRRQSPIPRRRRIAGWALAIGGIPVLTGVLLVDHQALSLSTILLLNLLLVVAVAAVGGLRPAVVAAVVSAQTVNWFFTEPVETFWIDDEAQLVALLVFVAVGVLVGVLVGRSARRSAEAGRARAEAEALATTAGRLSGRDDPVRGVLGHLRITFEQSAVAVMERTGEGGWRVDLVDGDPPPRHPSDGLRFELADGLELVLVPGHLAAEDLRVLAAFARQLADGLERRSLEAAAIEVDARSRAEALRTAILRAVSHDLRSPLASIKASSTSLLQDDIEWSPEQRREFAATIDEEADRLNRLVANLLDMSRIEAGAVHPSTRGVALDEVVAAALDTVDDADRVRVDVPAALPEVHADAVLLERVIANLTTNALEHARPRIEGVDGARPTADAEPDVCIEADIVGGRAVIRIVDRGTGIDPAVRDSVFDPFQRLDDTSPGGVGLGLAVVRGFVAAMGGEVTLDDTPGGGVTATIVLDLPDGATGATAGAPADPGSGSRSGSGSGADPDGTPAPTPLVGTG
jgi:two-component system, OmpR family, sensor histidine kinase KdpD